MGAQQPAGLTDIEIEQYFNEGYVLVPELVAPDEIASYDAHFHALVQGDVPLAPDMKIMQDVMVVKGAVEPETPVHAINKLLCLENYPELFAYVRSPAVVAVAQSLLGESIYSLASNVFNKPPRVDGRHPLHQDLRYFRLSPADKIVGVWTAMLPARRETGCLAVIPGSHKRGMLDHANPDWEFVNHGFYGVIDVDIEERVHVEMAPGDTLFFHPLLIHGSGHNRSDAFRRAISVHYAAGDCVSEKPGWQTRGLTRRIA